MVRVAWGLGILEGTQGAMGPWGPGFFVGKVALVSCGLGLLLATWKNSSFSLKVVCVFMCYGCTGL